MREYFPLLVAGAIVGLFSAAFIIAYALMKNKKEAIGFDRTLKDSEIMKRLLGYAKPYGKNFLAVLLLMLVSVSYGVISPLLIGNIEDLVKSDFELSALYIRLAVYISILLLSLAATYAQSIILQRTGQKILSDLRNDLFRKIESLSHEQLHKLPVGKLVSRITSDTNAISHLFVGVLVNLAKNFFMVICVFVAMVVLNYELALMITCFVPFIVLFTLIFRKFSRKAYRAVRDGTTDINTFLSENLSGIKIIQAFNREQAKLDEFSDKNNKLRSARFRQLFVFGIFRPVVYMLYVTSVMCLFYLGGKGYLDGASFLGQTITAGTLVTFYMYISKFFNPIQSLAEQFNFLQSAFASAEKIFIIMDEKPTVNDTDGATDIEKIHGDIEFKNVWFAYEPDEWILKDLSFKIRAGETAAFVGATGAGKTTILSLLCRNYDIQKGQILVDGKDITEYTISSLRRRIGQMLQDVFLFSGTIRSNIALDGEFTDDEIKHACEYVNADKFIERLPDGLDHEIRERGNNLSAGQRQLLSFARTVIHKPDVMILDEATANIDAETESLIRNSLEKMMNRGTMLIVAHRLSTVRHADVIIVMDDGQIIEQGTHDELIAKKGKYYNLYTVQYERERLKSSVGA